MPTDPTPDAPLSAEEVVRLRTASHFIEPVDAGEGFRRLLAAYEAVVAQLGEGRRLLATERERADALCHRVDEYHRQLEALAEWYSPMEAAEVLRRQEIELDEARRQRAAEELSRLIHEMRLRGDLPWPRPLATPTPPLDTRAAQLAAVRAERDALRARVDAANSVDGVSPDDAPEWVCELPAATAWCEGVAHGQDMVLDALATPARPTDTGRTE